MMGVFSGIEMAVWDLVGKAHGSRCTTCWAVRSIRSCAPTPISIADGRVTITTPTNGQNSATTPDDPTIDAGFVPPVPDEDPPPTTTPPATTPPATTPPTTTPAVDPTAELPATGSSSVTMLAGGAALRAWRRVCGPCVTTSPSPAVARTLTQRSDFREVATSWQYSTPERKSPGAVNVGSRTAARAARRRNGTGTSAPRSRCNDQANAGSSSENVIQDHPAVIEVAVIAAPHERWASHCSSRP